MLDQTVRMLGEIIHTFGRKSISLRRLEFNLALEFVVTKDADVEGLADSVFPAAGTGERAALAVDVIEAVGERGHADDAVEQAVSRSSGKSSKSTSGLKPSFDRSMRNVPRHPLNSESSATTSRASEYETAGATSR